MSLLSIFNLVSVEDEFLETARLVYEADLLDKLDVSSVTSPRQPDPLLDDSRILRETRARPTVFKRLCLNQ